jgi:predicted enzyme related to lactoylglutathione lyase
MGIRWQSVCIDASQPAQLADFWAAALGWRITYSDPDEIVLQPPAGSREDGVGPDLLFLQVPEGKAGKNRLHIDLRPEDRDEEVRRLEALGARRADIGQGPDVTWIVLADPEGNEFCVLRALRPDEQPG